MTIIDRYPLAEQIEVAALTPIRNRAWILDRHVQAFQAQTKPPLWHLYTTGDNEDETLERLRNHCHGFSDPDPLIDVDIFDTGCPAWHRSKEPRYSLNDHANLAVVYNHLIDEGLHLFPRSTHFWFVDSDVLPEPGCLEALLEAGEPVCGAVVEHSPGVYSFIVGEAGDGDPARSPSDAEVASHNTGVFEVGLVSCCVLYERRVLEAKDHNGQHLHRFAPHPRSHDFPMMESIREVDELPVVEVRARATHVMEEET